MKKNTCIFLLVCLLQIGFVCAQTSTIDSLKWLLQIEKQDSGRCLLLERLSREYIYYKPDTALQLGEEALELAKKINFTKGEAASLSEIGFIFSLTGNDAKALELSLQGLKKAEIINERQLESHILSDIAHYYADQGDNNKALTYFFQSREIASSVHDEYQLMVCSNDLGDTYDKLNQFDSARFYTNQAFDFAIRQKNVDYIGTALNNLGNTYLKMQQPVVAMAYYRSSLPYILEVNDNEDISEVTLGMAKIFGQQKQEDSCLHYAKLSFAVAQKSGFTEYILRASSFLADHYKHRQIVDSAYAYLSTVIAIKDSRYSQEKLRQIQSLSFDETMRQQEIAIEKKKSEENHVRNLQLLAIGVFIPIFFIGVLLLSRTKVKSRVVEFLGILSLLLFFEFITDLIYPYVSQLTNENPIWEMLFLVSLAALLEPLNFKLEHWVKRHLVHRPVPVSIPLAVEDNSYDVE